MNLPHSKSYDTIVRLLALSSRLEDDGQLNSAKMTRAAAESLLRRAAHQLDVPKERPALATELERVEQDLESLGVSAELRTTLKQGASALRQNKLLLNQDAPNPYVCRVCGYLVMGTPKENCPTCDSRPGSFLQVMPIYWFDALDPFAALATMRETPKLVAALLEGLTPEQLDRAPANDEWAIYNVVSHLRDAQQVLAYRLNLILTQDNPPLESLALFDTAGETPASRETTRDIFDTYLKSRQETIARLEQIPLHDWWRTGQHQEFGRITLKQQVSYFIAHEIIHLPQLEALRT